MVGFGVMCFGLWCAFVGYELGGLAVGLSFGDLVRVGVLVLRFCGLV